MGQRDASKTPAAEHCILNKAAMLSLEKTRNSDCCPWQGKANFWFAVLICIEKSVCWVSSVLGVSVEMPQHCETGQLNEIPDAAPFKFLQGAPVSKGLPRWLSGKESTCNAADTGDAVSVPRWGWSPGVGNGNPLQYTCLEDPMDKGAWWATIHRVAKSWTCLSTWHTQVALIFEILWCGNVLADYFGRQTQFRSRQIGSSFLNSSYSTHPGSNVRFLLDTS